MYFSHESKISWQNDIRAGLGKKTKSMLQNASKNSFFQALFYLFAEASTNVISSPKWNACETHINVCCKKIRFFWPFLLTFILLLKGAYEVGWRRVLWSLTVHYSLASKNVLLLLYMFSLGQAPLISSQTSNPCVVISSQWDRVVDFWSARLESWRNNAACM